VILFKRSAHFPRKALCVLHRRASKSCSIKCWPAHRSCCARTLNIPSLARQRCLPSWGPRRIPWFFFSFFVISQLFDAVDYSH